MAAERVIPAPVKWENPPPPAKRESIDHRAVSDELKTNPGVWGRIASYANATSSSSVANLVRTARTQAYAPAGSFEAVARKVSGKYWVYARYVGEGGEYAAYGQGETKADEDDG